MSDMEVACTQRINQLTEWKRKATFQLKQLYEQLRVAVPEPEYQAVQKELEISKQRNGDLIFRSKEQQEKNSNLATELRKIKEQAHAQREL